MSQCKLYVFKQRHSSVVAPAELPAVHSASVIGRCLPITEKLGNYVYTVYTYVEREQLQRLQLPLREEWQQP